MRRIFLLSPAKVTGARAGFLLNPDAQFPLARKFHRDGLTLAEVFSFASGLYFRGKITYAEKFAQSHIGDLVRIITTNAGLLDPAQMMTPGSLREFGEVDIDADDPRYHAPLRRDANALAGQLHPEGQVVLLGSIATTKYREVLLECFGDRLLFPSDFVGRGDMSRGGLLLRAAKSGTELTYSRVAGAILHGKRAPRIDPGPKKKLHPRRSKKRKTFP